MTEPKRKIENKFSEITIADTAGVPNDAIFLVSKGNKKFYVHAKRQLKTKSFLEWIKGWPKLSFNRKYYGNTFDIETIN